MVRSASRPKLNKNRKSSTNQRNPSYIRATAVKQTPQFNKYLSGMTTSKHLRRQSSVPSIASGGNDGEIPQ